MVEKNNINKKGKKGFGLMIGIIIILVLIFFLVWKSEPEADVIKIGATLALSGKYSFLGQSELHGLKLAIEDINNQGGVNGKKMVLIVEDNRGDPTEAVTGIRKLLDIDNVSIIISAFTHITNAIKDLVKEKNKIMIYESTYKPIAQESKYFFRDYHEASRSGDTVAKLVYNEGHKNVAFLSEISDICQVYESAFKKRASELGIKILKEEKYPITEKDLRTYLLKLDLKNVDALVTCSWRHEDILMKQLKELGLINVQTFHWAAPILPSGDTKEVRKLYEENNAISTWYGVAEPETEKQKEFFNKYIKLYNKKPRGDAMYMYDDMMLLRDVLKKCDDKGEIFNPDCLSDELLKIKDYDGVGGTLSFDVNGSSEREVTAIRVKNNEWVNYPVS